MADSDDAPIADLDIDINIGADIHHRLQMVRQVVIEYSIFQNIIDPLHLIIETCQFSV